MEVFDKVKSIIVDQLGRKPEDVTMNTTFEDMDVDSLDVVELIMAIEDEFDITIDDEDANRFQTMNDLVEYIKGKVE